MKNFKWMYLFIWMGFIGCLCTIIANIFLDKSFYFELCTLGWICTCYLLQRRVDQLESKN